MVAGGADQTVLTAATDANARALLDPGHGQKVGHHHQLKTTALLLEVGHGQVREVVPGSRVHQQSQGTKYIANKSV